MQKCLLLFLFTLGLNYYHAQSTQYPVEIVYNDCTILSELKTYDTIAGIRTQVTTKTIDACQYVQTLCNYGNPSANQYNSVHVIATISVVPDSAGILKKAIHNEFLKKIDEAEKYAASNNYTASVVPEHYFFRIDSLFIPGQQKLNSGNGNFMLWYLQGNVYKITIIEDNNIGNLNILLRKNIRLKLNDQLLDADAKIQDIVKIKELLNEWK